MTEAQAIAVIALLEEMTGYHDDQAKSLSRQAARAGTANPHTQSSLEKGAEQHEKHAGQLRTITDMLLNRDTVTSAAPAATLEVDGLSLEAMVYMRLAQQLAPLAYKGRFDREWLRRETRALADDIRQHGWAG